MNTNQAETAEELFNTLTDCIIFIGDLGYVLTQGELVRVRDGFRNMQARNKELEAESSRMKGEIESRIAQSGDDWKKIAKLEAENKLLREEWERMQKAIRIALADCHEGPNCTRESCETLSVALCSLKFSPYQK